MDIELFDFELPAERIAQHPVTPREAARLLVVGRELHDRQVADLPDLLRPGDLLVLNDTKVIPARLSGRLRNARGEGRVEITLHMREADDRWRVFAKPARRLAPGAVLDFAGTLSAEVLGRGEGGEAELRFDRGGAALLAALEAVGQMPLPPYIKRGRPGDPRDRQDYQTVFARSPGAVAAPTAGLHFTPALLDRLAARGIERVEVTLHVGAGTFLPVRSPRVEDHRMHAEVGVLSPQAAERINAARAAGGRIVAVGTTSLRLLESAANDNGQVDPFAGSTDLFILPGYRFKAVDLLMTNFHLPRSTLFMLVCAFSGIETMKAAYAHAVEAGYRFYSYGDACLLSRDRDEAGAGGSAP